MIYCNSAMSLLKSVFLYIIDNQSLIPKSPKLIKGIVSNDKILDVPKMWQNKILQ
jgi:hypothetical protein